MTSELYHGDCLELLPRIADKSVDMILADLPYGTTSCAWDSIIDLNSLWVQYKRVTKDRGAIILTSSQPFTTKLISSNYDMFKYCWVWIKNRPSDKFNAHNKPLKAHEDICAFSIGTTANKSERRMNYFPQGLEKSGKMVRGATGKRHHGSRPSWKDEYVLEFTGYPNSILYFQKDDAQTIHPTQKPVSLMEYLIRTYTNEGDTVLDNTMGSGSTGVGCANTGRNFIGMELYPLPDKPIDPKTNPNYFFMAQDRIHAAEEESRKRVDAPKQGDMFGE